MAYPQATLWRSYGVRRSKYQWPHLPYSAIEENFRTCSPPGTAADRDPSGTLCVVAGGSRGRRTVFAGFTATSLQLDDTTIFARVGGTGPTAAAPSWFSRNASDVEGYRSGLGAQLYGDCRRSSRLWAKRLPGFLCRSSPYAKRAMAGDMVQVMQQLGFEQFMIAGHDRGGRVAYRLALDHPNEISKVAVLDVIPTAAAWDRADARLALGFWPWSLLAQPEPLPERLIGAAPDAIVDNAIVQWGSPAEMFSAEVREAYVKALRDPVHIHAICEDYRAAATIDREHDALDQIDGRRITCPLLALWSSQGGLETCMRRKADRWLSGGNGPTALQGARFRAGTSFQKSTLARPQRLSRNSSRMNRRNDA
ncbi:putative Haloacetate dehalogenase [Mesorhizobium ventifaucium]|uniref:Haloacetate dehalogenase n=1 Tax=Mesorhizobium ventifaucium TaxID=666020 RepID=A0ABM9E524_9HYPH|nr:putative Haloacetate dehalogenase [Mesorhizobium ventifaucium]